MKEVPLWMRVPRARILQAGVCFVQIQYIFHQCVKCIASIALVSWCGHVAMFFKKSFAALEVLYFTADVGVCLGRQRHALKEPQTKIIWAIISRGFLLRLLRLVGCGPPRQKGTSSRTTYTVMMSCFFVFTFQLFDVWMESNCACDPEALLSW